MPKPDASVAVDGIAQSQTATKTGSSASTVAPSRTVTEPRYQPDAVSAGTNTSTHALRVSPCGTVTGKASRASWTYGSSVGISPSGTRPVTPLASDGVVMSRYA